MKKSFFFSGVAALALFGLASCGNPAQDALNKAAEEIETSAQQAADEISQSAQQAAQEIQEAANEATNQE